MKILRAVSKISSSRIPTFFDFQSYETLSYLEQQTKQTSKTQCNTIKLYL